MEKSNDTKNCCCMNHGENTDCGMKHTPRKEEDLKLLKNRLNRIVGQLNGIGKMLDENRYCGDVLIQVAAVESALRSFGNIILKEHLETCVMEQAQSGNAEIWEETMELIKKLQ